MRRSGWVAVVAAVGLGLTGCSDPGTPSDTLPTAASTSAEPTLAPLGPADFPVPAEAREQTLDGVLAMNTYYFDLLNYSQTAPTGEWLRQVSDGCTICTGTANYFDSSADAGVKFSGGTFTVLASTGQLSDEFNASSAVRVQLDAVTAEDSAGQTIEDESFGAAELSGGAAFRWDQQKSAWLITQLDLSPV